MEKIDTDYKRQIWKIEAKLFNMRKPWRSAFRVMPIFFLSLFFQQLAVPRADEWSRFQNTIQEIQANASSNIGEIGSPKMSPSKLPFS